MKHLHLFHPRDSITFATITTFNRFEFQSPPTGNNHRTSNSRSDNEQDKWRMNRRGGTFKAEFLNQRNRVLHHGRNINNNHPLESHFVKNDAASRARLFHPFTCLLYQPPRRQRARIHAYRRSWLPSLAAVQRKRKCDFTPMRAYMADHVLKIIASSLRTIRHPRGSG